VQEVARERMAQPLQRADVNCPYMCTKQAPREGGGGDLI
jgi:hypothetical protein